MLRWRRVPTIGIREAPVFGARATINGISATLSPLNIGSTHDLNSDTTGQGPQVSIRNAGELSLDGLEKLSRKVETRVGAVRRLGLKPIEAGKGFELEACAVLPADK